MHLTTHLLTGWLLGNAFPGHDRRVRSFALLAAVLPDADGLPIIYDFIHDALVDPGPVHLYWYVTLHHALGHNVFALALVSVVLACLTPGSWKRRVGAWALYVLCFGLHIACDLVGTQWGIYVLWPVSEYRITGLLGYRWPLESWQNYAVFCVLFSVAVGMFLWRRRSPFEIFSERADPFLFELLVEPFRRELLGLPPRAPSAAADSPSPDPVEKP